MPESAWHLGGYETDPSYWALTAPDTAEIVHRTAIDLLKELAKRSE
jgi:hypothetical protein